MEADAMRRRLPKHLEHDGLDIDAPREKLNLIKARQRKQRLQTLALLTIVTAIAYVRGSACSQERYCGKFCIFDRRCPLGAGLWIKNEPTIQQESSSDVDVNFQRISCPFDGKMYYPGPFNSATQPSESPSYTSHTCPDPHEVPKNSKFPFFFGVATAAHQIEGASSEDGKGQSIWNWFETQPGKIADGTTADVADDFYHKFEQDVKLMSYLGIRNFRFSLSWPRILPTGRPPLNQPGVDFYKRLIHTLRKHCIEPLVTLYHWDLPLSLYEEYGGWIDPQIETDFVQYAETVWEIFKDDVMYWTTMNEPETYCSTGYEWGVHAPGRCSDRSKCSEGNTTTEGFKCAYHTLNAHAKAEKSFRRIIPKGKLGINLSMGYMKSVSDTKEDKDACQRLMEYNAGRYSDVLFTGDWSDTLKNNVPKGVLPEFTSEQTASLKGIQHDFFALQHYTSAYCGYAEDFHLQAFQSDKDPKGNPLPLGGLPWLKIVPDGLRHLLVWLKTRYTNIPPIIITENGMCMRGEESMSMTDLLCDRQRLDFYRDYIGNATLAATQDGVDVQGYYAWSLLDNYEWAEGLSKRFGLVYVDYVTLRRYVKTSVMWLSGAFGVSDRRSVGSSGSGDGSKGY